MRSIKRIAAAFAAMCLGVMALSGCAAGPAVVPGTVPAASALAAGPDPFAEGPSPARVSPMDTISVTVVREKELSLEKVRIDQDGTFDMPYIGRVMAAGRSTTDIASDVQQRLGATYLRDPRVSVNIVEYSSRMVTVEGSVAQPGVYAFQPDTTLLGAVALARGPTRSARLHEVAIFRRSGDKRSVAVFDLKQVRAGRMIDPVLEPGDRVVIGFSGLSQAWQDFLQAAPLVAVFSAL